MEKVAQVLHDENLANRGRRKREEKGFRAVD